MVALLASNWAEQSARVWACTRAAPSAFAWALRKGPLLARKWDFSLAEQMGPQSASAMVPRLEWPMVELTGLWMGLQSGQHSGLQLA